MLKTSSLALLIDTVSLLQPTLQGRNQALCILRAGSVFFEHFECLVLGYRWCGF